MFGHFCLMREQVTLRVRVIAAIAGSLVCIAAQAQTTPKKGECRPEELDMGDYCASLPPARSRAEMRNRRVTPFRAVGMMPGRAYSESAAPSGQLPVTSPASPPNPPVGEGGTGYFVQLGAYSSLELAESVAVSVESPGPPARVVPVHAGDRKLWACVVGSFRDRESGVEARDRLRLDERFRSAYVKFMALETEQGLAHDNTEK